VRHAVKLAVSRAQEKDKEELSPDFCESIDHGRSLSWQIELGRRLETQLEMGPNNHDVWVTSSRRQISTRATGRVLRVSPYLRASI